jgi:hypothetical protein
MSSTPQDCLDVLQEIYQDALNNEPHDLAQAMTAAQVAAVQQYVANARATYFAAAAAALNNTGPGVDAAFTAAQAALDAVKQARAESEQIATLLQKLNNATAVGTNLLNAAKSA